MAHAGLVISSYFGSFLVPTVTDPICEIDLQDNQNPEEDVKSDAEDCIHGQVIILFSACRLLKGCRWSAFRKAHRMQCKTRVSGGFRGRT